MPRSSSRPTIKKVASAAGVSTQTVSRVINGEASVRDALEVMVAEAVNHLPVVDSRGHLVGICTRTDMLRATGSEH